MNFEDLKDQLITELKSSWERFQESSLYHKLRNTYENLNPRQQKLSIAGLALFIILTMLWFPFSSLHSSQDFLYEYTEKRETIRTLFQVQREVAETANLPASTPADSFKSQIEAKLQELRLIPSQIKSIEAASPNSQLISAQFSEGGLNINLSQLNIRQVVEIGSYLQSLSPTLKMVDLLMNTFPQDERYYDVSYHLVALKIPQYEPPPPPEIEKPSKKNVKDESQ
jgi:hypothetical protein